MNLRMAGQGTAEALADAMGVDVAVARGLLQGPPTGGPPKSDYWAKNAASPGNSWVLPHQATEHAVGDARWQYPFFRADLVRAGLLPPESPAGAPAEIRLPPGMSVMDAIEKGVIS